MLCYRLVANASRSAIAIKEAEARVVRPGLDYLWLSELCDEAQAEIWHQWCWFTWWKIECGRLLYMLQRNVTEIVTRQEFGG